MNLSDWKWISEDGEKRRLVSPDGYKFRFHKNLVGEVRRFQCVYPRCTAYVKMVYHDVRVEEQLVHIHSPPAVS